MRLPRLHPADRPAAAGQATAVLMCGSWCGVTTYYAVQSWTTLPHWADPLLGAAGGVGAATATLAGLLFAGTAGAQAARRAINDHLQAQARDRADRAERAGQGGRHRVPAHAGRPRRDGWQEVNDDAASGGAARRTLDTAVAHRFALPAGTPGAAAAAPGMVEQLPAGVDLPEGPEDPRWLPAVRRLAEVLVAEVQPEDGCLRGRGVSQLAEDVAARVPELDAATVRSFVRDYMNLRAGYRAPSGRAWLGAMPEVADRGRRAG